MNGEHPDKQAQVTKDAVTVCYWLRDEDGNDQANCGGTWTLNDGTPPENDMKYCPYCGKPISWSDYSGDDDDGE